VRDRPEALGTKNVVSVDDSSSRSGRSPGTRPKRFAEATTLSGPYPRTKDSSPFRNRPISLAIVYRASCLNITRTTCPHPNLPHHPTRSRNANPFCRYISSKSPHHPTQSPDANTSCSTSLQIIKPSHYHRISKTHQLPSKGKTHTASPTIHSQPARPLQLTHQSKHLSPASGQKLIHHNHICRDIQIRNPAKTDKKELFQETTKAKTNNLLRSWLDVHSYDRHVGRRRVLREGKKY